MRVEGQLLLFPSETFAAARVGKQYEVFDGSQKRRRRRLVAADGYELDAVADTGERSGDRL